MYLHRGEVRQLAPLHLYGLARRWRSVFESFLRLGGALRLRLLTAQDDLVCFCRVGKGMPRQWRSRTLLRLATTQVLMPDLEVVGERMQEHLPFGWDTRRLCVIARSRRWICRREWCARLLRVSSTVFQAC